jgi:hypothetical protein
VDLQTSDMSVDECFILFLSAKWNRPTGDSPVSEYGSLTDNIANLKLTLSVLESTNGASGSRAEWSIDLALA